MSSDRSSLFICVGVWRGRIAERIIRRANGFRDRGEYARAASLYRRALVLDSRRGKVYIQLAHMLKELTLFREAEAAYRKGMALLPHDSDIYTHYGDLLVLLGRAEKAERAYRTADELRAEGGSSAGNTDGTSSANEASSEDRHLQDRYILEGDNLRDDGRHADAADFYAKALKLVPERTDIRIQYGNMLKDAGRQTDAEAAYRTALLRCPGDAEIYLQLGHTLKLQGRTVEAIRAYRHAAQLRPSLETAWVELVKIGYMNEDQLFDQKISRGGIDALIAVTDQVERLNRSVLKLVDVLPNLCTQMAFPISAYDRYRRFYDIPPPPETLVERRFGVILCACEIEFDELYLVIRCMNAQSYRQWKLYIVGSDPRLRRVVDRAAMVDFRISWNECDASEQPAVAECQLASTASRETEWLLLLAPGAVLHEHALAWFGAVVCGSTASAFISDEETIEESGGYTRRLAPQLRQFVDYYTLLEHNPYGHTILVDGVTYAADAASLAKTSLSASRTSLLLNLTARGVVGHIPLPLVGRRAVRIEDEDDEQTEPVSAAHWNAVRAHLLANGLEDQVNFNAEPTATVPMGVFWQPRAPSQIIEIIILTRDNGKDLQEFVSSLRNQTAISDLMRVLIIDNGSREADTIRVLDHLSATGVQVVRMDEPFNWSRLNNSAAASSDADLLVFANDDMVMLSEGWDQRLRGLLERPDIGAVGARLLYPDDSIQHAGVLFGWPGIDAHDGRYEALSNPGPCSRWHVTRTVSAVTGAFLAVRREIFETVGGFDEVDLPVGYSDMDFALKVRALGKKVVWTPSITLHHFESKTRGLDHLDREKEARAHAERAVFQERWAAALEPDPSINPTWHPGSFQLLSAPSQARLWRHIRLCASPNPWLVQTPEAGHWGRSGGMATR